MRLFQVIEGIPCSEAVLPLAADLPTICVATLGGMSFHNNNLVCKENRGQQFIKVKIAIMQYVLIPPWVTLCIHALKKVISCQFCNCPIVELIVIGLCPGWAIHVPGQLCCRQYCACDWSPFLALGHCPQWEIPQQICSCLPPTVLEVGQSHHWASLPHKCCPGPPQWCCHDSAHILGSGLLWGSPLERTYGQCDW